MLRLKRNTIDPMAILNAAMDDVGGGSGHVAYARPWPRSATSQDVDGPCRQ